MTTPGPGPRGISASNGRRPNLDGPRARDEDRIRNTRTQPRERSILTFEARLGRRPPLRSNAMMTAKPRLARPCIPRAANHPSLALARRGRTRGSTLMSPSGSKRGAEESLALSCPAPARLEVAAGGQTHPEAARRASAFETAIVVDNRAIFQKVLP